MKYKFPVVEIFDSIEGEGKRTGYLSTFIRFAGCNLRCSYCDTAYALSADDAAAEYTADELAQIVQAKPWSRVTLTGGEPMLQPLQELTERLCRFYSHLYIACLHQYNRQVVFESLRFAPMPHKI